MKKSFIEVKGTRIQSTYDYRDYLLSQKLRYSKKTNSWLGWTLDPQQAERIQSFCHKNHLICLIYDKKHTRGSNYRDIFFENNPPFFGKYYVCAYCFRPMTKEKTSVDHIIAVKKAKANKAAKWLMKRLNMSDVNDERNLCAACPSCNAMKSSKAGFWIVRGFLGKKKWIVSLFYLMVLLILIVLITGIIYIYRKGV